MVVSGTFPFLSCFFVSGLCPFPSCLFVSRLCFLLLSCFFFVVGLYLLPSCVSNRGLSPLPCSMVHFLDAWCNSFLVASFVINNGILLNDVLTFDTGLLGCVLILGWFSLWHCVLCSIGYELWTSYVVYIEGLEFQLCSSVFGLGLWCLPHFWLPVLAFDHCSKNLPSNWMIFFTLCWDVRGKGWSNRYDTSIKFLTLLLQFWTCFFIWFWHIQIYKLMILICLGVWTSFIGNVLW